MPKKQTHLSVASPDARPKVKDPKTVRDAADHSQRALLVALRTKIAGDIDNGVPAAYLAPLSRQIREVDREIGRSTLLRSRRRPRVQPSTTKLSTRRSSLR